MARNLRRERVLMTNPLRIPQLMAAAALAIAGFACAHATPS